MRPESLLFILLHPCLQAVQRVQVVLEEVQVFDDPLEDAFEPFRRVLQSEDCLEVEGTDERYFLGRRHSFAIGNCKLFEIKS